LGLGDNYTGAVELSLDMATPERADILKKYGLEETRELKPYLVLYHAKDLAFEKGKDKVRVAEPPLLCVEIVSPTEGAFEILNNFRVYFDIGVKSCWYVDPILETVHVYNDGLDSTAVFHNTSLVDHAVGANIPLDKIFC
jgi:Uma2 family endonuclease